MIVIADSGSTKTDWVLKQSSDTKELSSEGLNPKVKSKQGILKDIKKVFSNTGENNSVEAVYFYGAGCSNGFYKNIVKEALTNVFSNAQIEVEHDLLGAARALFQNKSGIACILGTGSNSCFYNGKEITDNINSLGYLAGDEGSGFHIGKSLIQAYTYRELNKKLNNKFETYFSIKREELVQELYKQSQANKYIASFAPFCSKNIDHIQIQSIVTSCFQKFIERHIKKYPNHKKTPVGFVGSIANVFQLQLKEVLKKEELSCTEIITKPINNLITYHQ